MNVTVKQFTEIAGCKNGVQASSVINYLADNGHAKRVGKKRPASGRGKPSIIYQIPQEVSLTLFADEDVENTIVIEPEADENAGHSDENAGTETEGVEA
jgi:hypothetical protein